MVPIIHPYQGSWEELQERFRTQFYKIGYAREKLFHSVRSFFYDENAVTIDAYVKKYGK